MEDPLFVSAYTLFYMPSNYLKLKYLIENLNFPICEQLKECDFIDYGCGPGTYSYALLDLLGPSNFHGTIFLIDRSKIMLKQAKKIITTFFPNFTAYQTAHHYTKISNRPTCLFFGNSANELGLSKTKAIIENISPDFLFFYRARNKQSLYKLNNPPANYLINNRL